MEEQEPSANDVAGSVDVAYRNASERALVHNKAMVFGALAAAGMTSVKVFFDGADDSGQIEDVCAYTGMDRTALPEARVEIMRVVRGNDQLERDARVSLRDAIERLCYDVLEQQEPAWKVDDGACGEFTFRVAQERIELTLHVRYVEVTTTHRAY